MDVHLWISFHLAAFHFILSPLRLADKMRVKMLIKPIKLSVSPSSIARLRIPKLRRRLHVSYKLQLAENEPNVFQQPD